MHHPKWFVFIVSVALIAFSFAPASGEEKKADVKVKGCTACIPSCSAEMQVKEGEKAQDEKIPVATTGNSTQNETGDINVYNYGIQAIFINSNVTVNGGTISGEMTKTAEKEEAAGGASGKPAPKPSEGTPGQSSGETKEEKPGKFDELIKDATKEAGLFTVYSKKTRRFSGKSNPIN